MTADAKVETLRLFGLSAARLDERKELSFVFDELASIKAKNATQKLHFLRGFAARLAARWDDAEEEYRKSHRLSPTNMSTNRELASVFLIQGRHADAEGYARAAYEHAPSNPYLIDMLARTLSGKASQGLRIDERELEDLVERLKRHGNEPGLSFYDISQAEYFLRKRNYVQAKKSIDSAIAKTPTLVSSHFLRAEINLFLNAIGEAEQDLVEAGRLLEKAGFEIEDEVRFAEIQVKIHIDKLEFQVAKEKAERSNVLRGHIQKRLLKEIARAVGFEPQGASAELKKWAKDFR